MFIEKRVRSKPELRVLTVLILNEPESFTARELCVKSNVHLSLFYNIIKQLEEEGEVTYHYREGDDGGLVKHYAITEDVEV